VLGRFPTEQHDQVDPLTVCCHPVTVPLHSGPIAERYRSARENPGPPVRILVHP
jgi:hypothetical protein